MSTVFENNRYLIRRKLLKIFGASFHIYSPGGALLGFCAQKAFRLKEDIRIYTDESKRVPLMSIRARAMIDFSAGYDIVDETTGESVGAARRKGFSSLLRDSWEVLDSSDHVLGQVKEDSMLKASMRRFLSNLIPQTFQLGSQGSGAVFKQRFNPLIYKLEVSLDPECTIDPRLVFGVATLIAAIEGRQD